MKKRIIIRSLILLVIAIPVVLIYLTFSNSTNCNQFVIDTYEIHSNIDIPQVEVVNCYFNEELNTRISVYDLKGFIDLNDFQTVNCSSTDILRGMALLTEEERPLGSNLYLASGESWGTKWTYAIDQETNRLYAELNY